MRCVRSVLSLSSMDVSMIIEELAREADVWSPEAEWRATTHVRFAGTPTMAVTVEMDVVLRNEFERMLKTRCKLNVKIVLSNHDPQPIHPINASLVVSCSHTGRSAAGTQAEYPDGTVRFMTPGGAIEDVPLPPLADGINKEKKLRLAFKKMFIIMVTEGFIMPGDDQVKHVGFASNSFMPMDNFMVMF